MQLSGINLTVVHTSCLPGYFLRDGGCICEETTIVALCDPFKRGVILNVSSSYHSGSHILSVTLKFYTNTWLYIEWFVGSFS